MIKSFIGMTFLSALAAQSLSAQTASTSGFSVTPRLSHNYTRTKLSTTTLDNTTGVKTNGSGTNYSNALRYDIEAAWSQNDNLEWLVNFGYQPNYKTPSEGLELFNYEIGVRGKYAGAYAQFSLGDQNYKSHGVNHNPDADFNVPVAGIGLGYIYQLTDTFGIEIFYRGYVGLDDSESQKIAVSYDAYGSEEGTGVQYDQTDARINKIENHQAGLGANFKF